MDSDIGKIERRLLGGFGLDAMNDSKKIFEF